MNKSILSLAFMSTSVLAAVNFFDLTPGTVYNYKTIDKDEFQMQDSVIQESKDTICEMLYFLQMGEPICYLNFTRRVLRSYVDLNSLTQIDTVLFIQEEPDRLETRPTNATSSQIGRTTIAFKETLKEPFLTSNPNPYWTKYWYTWLITDKEIGSTNQQVTSRLHTPFDYLNPTGMAFLQTEPNEHWRATKFENNKKHYSMMAVPEIGIVWVKYVNRYGENIPDKVTDTLPKYNPKFKDYYLASIVRDGDTLYKGSANAYPLTEVTTNLTVKSKDQIYQIYDSEGKLIKENLPQVEYQSFLKTLPKGSYFSTTKEGKTKLGQMIRLN